MKNWEIKISSDYCQEILSLKFHKEFPNRSKSFFLNLLKTINHKSTKICLLEVEEKIEGAMILFRVEGYNEDIYAPSYFFVSQKFRNLSLTFLMKGQQMVSNYILNITACIERLKLHI